MASGDRAVEQAIQRAEASLESLRIAYEQYFSALTRRPPLEQDAQVAQAIQRARSSAKSAAHRFRADALNQRYQSYKRMWARVVREREEGTYRRDVFKAKMRSRREAEGEQRAVGKKEERQAPRLPSEEELRELHRAFLAARREVGASEVGVPFERLAAAVTKQSKAIMEKHGVNAVDLRVQIRDGKAVVQASPRRGEEEG